MWSLEELLKEGIQSGQIGLPSEPHGEHAMGFFSFLGESDTMAGKHALDLGSGVGLPGLVLANAFPETHWTLVERRGGRAALLRKAVRRLRFTDHVRVVEADATVAAWTDLRESQDFVVARSFGPPADTAECAVGFLRPHGSVIVSEPPTEELQPGERWPQMGLTSCGLAVHKRWVNPAGTYVQLVRNDNNVDHLPRTSSRVKPLF